MISPTHDSEIPDDDFQRRYGSGRKVPVGDVTPIRETIARAIAVGHGHGDPDLPWHPQGRSHPHARPLWQWHLDDADRALRGIGEAGLVVVPREPTLAMLEAAPARPAADAISMGLYGSVYRAMISAAVVE